MNDQDLYLKGMNDLAEALEWYRKQDNSVVQKIFDGKCYGAAHVLNHYEPQDFVNRINNYKKEQEKPKFGDVVKIIVDSGFWYTGIFIGDLVNDYQILAKETNYPYQYISKDFVESITKTGEHIDIRGMLDKLA